MTMDFAKLAGDFFEQKAAEVYEQYEKRLAVNNALDFDDLLTVPLHILTVDNEVREQERSRVDWVLVDEYQDVNRTQYLLLNRLIGESRRIMVVGDPDQSIYGWRGADMGMILNFEPCPTTLSTSMRPWCLLMMP